MMKRILALDVGEKRIGVAVSDPFGWTAQGVETIFTRGTAKDVERIAQLLAQYDTDRLLLGLPRTLSGQTGPQAERILAFAEHLTARGWQVRYQDERLTTAQAHRTLIEGDVKRAQRKQVVDKLAATYILQAFLDAGGWIEETNTNEEVSENTKRLNITEVQTWRTVSQNSGSDQKGGLSMANNNENMMEMDNIIELFDENDNPVRFEHIMTLQYKADDYVLLAPVDPTDDMEEDEVLVLMIDNDENGEEIYVSVDDDDVVQKVFEKYLEIVEADEE